jgi:phosphoserine phosphatase RsbU/P
MASEPARGGAPPAFLIIKSPSGAETRVALEHLPFRMGRHADNELVLRDSRSSRHHAQIVVDKGQYVLEDLGSSYGVSVNGARVERKKLRNSDRIEFGSPDSYAIVFSLGDLPSSPKREKAPTPVEIAGGANLSKLRAMLEVARALQTSLSTDDVLATVVEAALAVTGCERGFLLMRQGDELTIRIARAITGPLAETDLRVPTRLLMRALAQRKEFLSMNFDPSVEGPERTVADLELRSVVCVPLVRVRTGAMQDTAAFNPMDDTVGVLYMDSRLKAADLSSGGREILTTLALEASTVLENARLLEEQWASQRMQQELRIARQIQESLLPRLLPATGWFRAAASSTPCLEVGGDYLDVRQTHPMCWAAISADVSGKGVGAALLASLLQGMFLAAPFTRLSMEEMMFRTNHFLNERTGGEQYATIFYCTVEASGLMRWVNAGHPPPLLAHASGKLDALAANGVPVGMMGETTYPVEESQLQPGDKIVMYSDGLTEARNSQREFYGLKRLCEVVSHGAGASCQDLHAAILSAVGEFTQGAPQNDDVSLVVLEYQPE